MNHKNRTLEGKNRTSGGKGSKMTPKNQLSFLDVPFVLSKARDLHNSLFGGRRMYIHNKYTQRIVFLLVGLYSRCSSDDAVFETFLCVRVFLASQKKKSPN